MRYEMEEITGWCAGVKVSLHSYIVDRANINEMMRQAAEDYEASVIVISVNVNEEKVIEWCKKNKFLRGPIMKNHGHSSRKTYLFFKQITKKFWNAQGCSNWD